MFLGVDKLEERGVSAAMVSEPLLGICKNAMSLPRGVDTVYGYSDPDLPEDFQQYQVGVHRE